MCLYDFEADCNIEVLTELAEQYILFCREAVPGADDHKKRERFPNIAGFCRHWGFSSAELARLRSEHSGTYDTLCLIFEDEALNSQIPATLLTAYLKKRLDYSVTDGTVCGDGGINVLFEHDINADGG